MFPYACTTFACLTTPGTHICGFMRCLFVECSLLQGDFLIELAVDIKPPKDWHKVCSTKKVHRWRPPQVTAAVAEREQASERLQVQLPTLLARLF